MSDVFQFFNFGTSIMCNSPELSWFLCPSVEPLLGQTQVSGYRAFQDQEMLPAKSKRSLTHPRKLSFPLMLLKINSIFTYMH